MNRISLAKIKAVSLMFVICVIGTMFSGCAGKTGNDFTLWEKEAKSLAALKEYVADVTNKNSKKYII